ncbi:RING finger protein 17 [Bufo bufo]|uniref:RING finger protein 17 n=1 Tax=Bufo bufo TaxID=8384 RepID=UPI001ABE1E03|nr:RING finger protein 17 [Bufo bufo]
MYTAELQNAVKSLEKQKKCLGTRVAFVEGLKGSPIMTAYCNLNQLVADLKMSFKNEAMLDSLKASPDLRFTMDSETVLETFDNLGAIYCVGSPKCQSISSGNEAFKKSHHLAFRPEDGNPEVHLNDCRKGFIYEQCESDFGFTKTVEHKMDTTNQLTPGKDFHAFQKSQSRTTPDVIIEEIIEEDQSCNGLPEAQNNTPIDCTNGKPLKKEFSNCKPKRVKKSQKMTGTCAPFSKKKITQEQVYLTHVINPSNIYVHRYSHKMQLIMLERMLDFLSRTGSHCDPADVLELGEIIAFKSAVRQRLCRGSITELTPLESKCIIKPCGPTRCIIKDIASLTLLLIDYGGSETFVATRFEGCYLATSDPVVCETKVDALHKILIKLTSADEETIRFMPPFAVHCSLGIVPPSPDALWGKESKEYILRVVGKKCVLMKVYREEDNKWIVDLKKPFDNKIYSEMPVSLRDALVFMELAKFPSHALRTETIIYYKDPILPKDMTEDVVVVCHFNDPSDFYIHLVGGTDYLDVMNRIQEVYNSKDAKDWQILYPVEGQPCIARYDIGDEYWYRAEIVALPNSQEAVIRYVDFGNIAKVDVAGLRRLMEEFMALPRKAISCSLAYIQPLNAGLWSSEACLLFEGLTSYKHLRCNSIGVLHENKLSVELFDVNLSEVNSINTMLVEKNVASFIPCTSDTGEHHLPLKEVWDPDILSDTVEMCMDNASSFEQKELDVFISNVVSPSKIYVQCLTSQNILKSLQANIFDRYENSEPEAIQWQIDMQVAVHLQDYKQWRRGTITNISDTLVEVFCYDFGKQEVMESTNLRILDESLMIYGTLCLECSLMDIQPAGGSQNWTATACDFLSCYLSEATVRMIIEDDASVWPLPVRIKLKNEAHNMLDISDVLVKKGLALRDRRMNKLNPVLPLLEAHDKRTPLSAKSCLQEQDPVEERARESNPECAKTLTSEPSNIAVPEEAAVEPMVAEPYLPPLLPEEKKFSAKVLHVAEDGTIYVIQECLENELGVLMLDIQDSFKCLGLMAPYSWRKGEGCLIKGSDTMTYRGKVLDILSGDMITVKYADYGYTEKIPKCHLYPFVYNPHIPRFCIPCQLNDIVPVGDHWQQDAIQLLKELLLKRLVTVHIVEPANYSDGVASVRIYCGNASVSSILEHYDHGVPTGCEKNNVETNCITDISYEKIWRIDFQELLQNGLETPLLPKYSSESLPRTGELFKVVVTHLQTPNLGFICIKNESGKSQISGCGDGVSESLQSILEKINSERTELSHLTDFRTDMPCLAAYSDSLLHRGKLQSIKSYDPVACVVEFVDYGATMVVDTSSLFQLPAILIQYPAKAIKVGLAGFKAPKEDFEIQRLQYCPEWSCKALIEMVDIMGGKTLSAACRAGTENTVFLYDENQQLVHKPLITMGLADVDEI